MKIGIYSPYLETFGGGERYMLTFAEYCLQRGFDTELFWHEHETIAIAMQRFHLQLSSLKLNETMFQAFQSEASYLSRLKKWGSMSQYDLIFYLSDGSVPYLRGKQNWLHFQVPFKLNGKTFWTQQKLTHIHRVICNSRFTKRFIDTSFGIQANVVYPPVSVHDFWSKLEKEPIILSVGRFDQILNAKRQDVLVEVFKEMVDEGLQDWWLILVGGSQHNADQLLQLREKSFGYPIEIFENASFEELQSWYQRAAVFWHGAGYEVIEKQEPEKVEHFGMSVVEAMAAGCIPIIHRSGGLKEVVVDKKNGYFWEEKVQLKKITLEVCAHLNKQAEIVRNAKRRALLFSKEAFFKRLDALL